MRSDARNRAGLLKACLVAGTSLAGCALPLAAQQTLFCNPQERGSVSCEANQGGMCDPRGIGVETSCSSAKGAARAAEILAVVLGGSWSASDKRISSYKAELMVGEFRTNSGKVRFKPLTAADWSSVEGASAPSEPRTPPPAAETQLCATYNGQQKCVLSTVAKQADAVRELQRLFCSPALLASCLQAVDRAIVRK